LLELDEDSRIILKLILEEYKGVVRTINQAENRDQRKALVNSLMNPFRFNKLLVNSELSELYGVGYLDFQLFPKRFKIRPSRLLCLEVNSENLNTQISARTILTAIVRLHRPTQHSIKGTWHPCLEHPSTFKV
jgi:hypothetical protein